MPIHVKKSSLLVVAVSLSFQPVLLPAAPSAAPARAPALAPAPAPQPPDNSGTPSDSSPIPTVDNSTSTALDYLFNHKPVEGSTAKAGGDVASALSDKIKALDVLKAPALMDPQTRARFQTYLSLKEIPDDRIKEYFDKIAQVSAVLKAGDTFTAWKILYAMSEYTDLDAGISRELANRVESVWMDNRTKNGIEEANDKLRDNIDSYDHNADMIASDLREEENEQRQSIKGNGGGGGSSSQSSGSTNSPLTNPDADPVAAEASLMPTMGGSLQGKMELTAEYIKLLEARAKIKLNEMREDRMSDEGKQAFAEYTKNLYDTHRYYHMIIAADFYRALFNEGNYPNGMANQASSAPVRGRNGRNPNDKASLSSSALGLNAQVPVDAINQATSTFGVYSPFGDTTQNTHPVSLSEQVTSALEINNRVSQAIEVFKYKAGRGEITAAAVELQEAFMGNEFHPGLQGLLREQKEKVGDYLAKLDVLKNQLESRDFEEVTGQLSDIKKIASDFDSTKPLALVNGVKLESQLRLGKAKLLAQQGQLTDAMKEFQTAAEEWPGNPALQNSANRFFSTEDVQNESTSEFDRLVQEQNYRAIFDKQLAFAAAVQGDDGRVQQLKDALGKVKKAEMASEKANMLVMNGDVDGAWETIELAIKDWPDDEKLNKFLANLSGRSADFVSALNKAQDAESKKELGYSLSWYVNAQTYYPASVIANDGIDRISKLILSPQSPSSDAVSN